MDLATVNSPSSPLTRTTHEEFVNTATHAMGLLLSIAAGFVLLQTILVSGTLIKVVCCSIYVASLVAVYTASTLSHGFRNPLRKTFWRMWDQALIYVLIAGSYTAFAMPLLHYARCRYMLALMWALALIGFCSKIFLRYGINRVSTLTYLAMAWLPLTAIQSAIELLPAGAIQWLFAGGIVYTTGVALLMLDRKAAYLHGAWHVFVILGSACHFAGIYYYILPATV